MTPETLSKMRHAVRRLTPTRRYGRIAQLTPTVVEVEGLSDCAHLGDEVLIEAATPLRGEITRVDAKTVGVLPYQRATGLSLGTEVTLLGTPRLAPDNTWIGRVLDPFGTPLDGAPLIEGPMDLPLDRDPPAAHSRGQMGTRLETGVGVIDTMLPLAAGQRMGLFAGSGVGKSTLLGRLARDTPADVCVLALIGERGRELREFLEKALGPEGLARSVVIAATSDMAPSVRRRAAQTAMTVAEHFRDQGAHVLFLADSITRFAEAHREVAVSSGEEANMRGFPPSLTPALAGLCERAGPGPEGGGTITAILSVLVAGSDMEEPVADILRGLIDGHMVMDRAIAERGRYPAIDVLRSVSRCLPEAASEEENRIITRTRTLLGAYDRAELMVQSGLYERGNDAQLDAAVVAYPKIDAFFGTPDRRPVEEQFEALRRATGA